MSTQQSSTQCGHATDRADKLTPLTVGGGIATVLSVLASVLAYGFLPGTIRIHWTLGFGPYYGPEHAPTALMLVLFPALVATLAFGFQRLATLLRADDGLPRIEPIYTVVALLSLAVVLLGQAVVVGANL